MGIVYRARDLQRDTIVALKTLLRYSPADLYGFKQEFRALADLNHRNLVSLYQLLSTGKQWCFTMELVQGQHFLAAVRSDAPQEVPATLSDEILPQNIPALVWEGTQTARRPKAPPRFHEQRLRDLLLQLVEGLSFLHEHGKLHCDLKPSNVMVDASGRVIILDFGLVQESTRVPSPRQPHAAAGLDLDSPELSVSTDHEATHTGVLRGTVLYMSPEQAACRSLTPATDWYAVGVILYEALTGQLPFRGGFEVVQRKQDEDAPPPSSLVDGLPADLEKLCVDLLQRDPAARPDGDEVLTRLGSTARPTSARAPQGFLPFVGRAMQFERLRAAWQHVRSGRGSLALMRGPSGAGKSALVQRFLDEIADSSGGVALRGRCFEQESVPFKAVDALMDHLSHMLVALPIQEVDELVPLGIEALVQMFPVLRRVISFNNALSEKGGKSRGPGGPPPGLSRSARSSRRHIAAACLGPVGRRSPMGRSR